ncbi:MAG: hypothetical protein ACK4E8_07805 [Lacibacter sp.]
MPKLLMLEERRDSNLLHVAAPFHHSHNPLSAFSNQMCMPRFYSQLLAVMQSFFSKFMLGVIFLILMMNAARAQSGGIYEGYVFLDVNGTFTTYHLQTNTNGTYFDGVNLGTFCNAQSLVFRGGENKIFKCGSCDFTGGAIYYRVYRQGNSAPGFTQLLMGFGSDISGAGPGCQNQIWQTTSGTQNILAGLTNGTYILEAVFNS